jgi:hypothetical protein
MLRGLVIALLATLTLTFLGGCSKRMLTASGSGGDAGTGTGRGGSGGTTSLGGAGGGPTDAVATDATDAAGFIVAGPCIEGMECNGNDPGGSSEFHCVCTQGEWVCPLHDTQGWLASDLPLPSADPEQGASCSGTNYACALPDRCGSLCVCTQAGAWACKTLIGDGNGGPVVVQGTGDAGRPSSVDAGCAWPSCSVYGAAPPPTAQCFTPVCFSTIHPSGDSFFAPGAGGCSMEH